MLDFHNDLRISLRPTVLLCASDHAVDAMGGPSQLIDYVFDELGEGATIVCPHFAAESVSLDGGEPAICAGVAPAVADNLAGRDGCCTSLHPAFGFAALGKHASFLTDRTPFHFPFGSAGVLDRLHQVDGSIVLMGLDGRANLLLHLAEVWAGVPYASRSVRVYAADGRWTEMHGCPYCSAGFRRAESVLRQARILREGETRGVCVQAMAARACVSMGLAMLRGDPKCLLCNDPRCASCESARRMTEAPEPGDDGPESE